MNTFIALLRRTGEVGPGEPIDYTLNVDAADEAAAVAAAPARAKKLWGFDFEFVSIID